MSTIKREWLVQLRKSQGLTQEFVALASFVDRAFYAKIESGVRDPGPHVTRNIARALGIHPEVFFQEGLIKLGSEAADLRHQRTIYTQCNLDLKYTWAYSPRLDVSYLLGKHDMELGTGPGILKLAELKQRVLKERQSCETVISLKWKGVVRLFSVLCEPIVSSNNNVVGLYTSFAYAPEITTHYLQLKASGPEELVQGPVLYFYDNLNYYTARIVRFITTNVNRRFYSLVVDNVDVISTIRDLLRTTLSEEDFGVYCNDQLLISINPDDNNPKSMIRRCKNSMSLILERGMHIGAWVNMPTVAGDDADHLEHFEKLSHKLIGDSHVLLVCAYSGKLPAKLQTLLLRHHQYLMTDKELVISPLYSDNVKADIWPSFSTQAKSTMLDTREHHKETCDSAHDGECD